MFDVTSGSALWDSPGRWYEAARAIVVEHAGGYGIGLDYARDMIKPL